MENNASIKAAESVLVDDSCRPVSTPSSSTATHQVSRAQNHSSKLAATLVSASLFTLVFIAYSLSSTLELEDYDSVNFALAVQSFNITLDAPHPPGAPVYIAFLKLVNLILNDIPMALSVSAALGGALFVAVWHRLFEYFLPYKTAAIATVILAVSPGLWMAASHPMSDTFAAAALSISFLLTLNYTKRRNPYYLLYTSAVLALAVGIRPQFGLLAPFLLLSTMLYFRPSLKVCVSMAMVFTLANLAWLLPTIVSQYNLDGSGWMTYFNQISRFKANFDTASGSPLLANNVDFLDTIGRAFIHLGTLGYFGLGLNAWYPESVAITLESLGTRLNPWDRANLEWTGFGTLYTLIFLFGCCALIPRVKYHWARAQQISEPVGYLILVAISYSAVVVMLVPPHTRFYLVLLPLVILLPLVGLQSRRWKHTFQYGLMALAILASSQTLIESVGQDAPPMALIKEIRAKSNAAGLNTVLLLDANASRHASWYLPSAKIYSGTTEQVPEDLRAIFQPGQQVFSNYPNALPHTIVDAAHLANYRRSHRVWMRHTSTDLYELTLRDSPLLAAPEAQSPPKEKQQPQAVALVSAEQVGSLVSGDASSIAEP